MGRGRGGKIIRGRFGARRRLGPFAFVPLGAGVLLVGAAYGAGWPVALRVFEPAATSTQAQQAPRAVGAVSGTNETGSRQGVVPATPTTTSPQAWEPAGAPAEPRMVRAGFGFCHTGGGENCVVDGDTLWLGGEKIRVADIDAPETHEPRCAAEQALGDRATRRLQQLLNGGAVSLEPIDRDEDRYGRKLRIVLVDGRSVGGALVEEGLARPYAGGRRPWC